MITKSSILQAAADRRARQAEEAKRRADMAVARAWRASNREAVKAAMERNRRERAYYKDVKLVRRYEGCQRALENALKKVAEGSTSARDTQRVYIQSLRDAIERDALEVAQAMARMADYEAQAEAEKQAEYLAFHASAARD